MPLDNTAHLSDMKFSTENLKQNYNFTNTVRHPPMEEDMTLFEINFYPLYSGMHAYVKIKYKIGRVVLEKKGFKM